MSTKKFSAGLVSNGVLLRPGVVQGLVSLLESGANPRLKSRRDGKCFADWAGSADGAVCPSHIVLGDREGMSACLKTQSQ